MSDRKIPKHLARSEAHAFILEMARQGLAGGALWCYNDESQGVIHDQVWELLDRHEKYAGKATMEEIEPFKRTE